MTAPSGPPPVCLAIGGSDPSGGAGIQADLKTFAALSVYGAAAVTALTVQNTRGVRSVHPVAPEVVAAQIEAVTGDLDVAAVKLGMLATAEVARAVADRLAARPPRWLVVDPVLVAGSGDPLSAPGLAATLIERLLPLATLVTPNWPEALALSGCGPEADPVEAARAIGRRGARAVLVKGGHLPGPLAVDWLVTPERTVRFERPRLAGPRLHGAGCALASACAAWLALGQSLEAAVRLGGDWVHAAIERAVPVGGGAVPVS